MAKKNAVTTAEVDAIANTAVSDEFARAEGTEIIQLAPEDITLDEHTDVRPWETATESEDDGIAALGQSIEDEGQIQAGVVRELIDAETGEITYHLIAGRRRRAAIIHQNTVRATRNESPLLMNVSVLRGVSDDSAFRKAILENGQRKQMSPMDIAMNIVATRERFGWTEKKDWSKRVAEFFGVSRAYVTQKMKLFDLSDELQAQVNTGALSEDAAFMMAKVKPEKREEVMQAAQEIASAEAGKSGKPVTETEQPNLPGTEVDNDPDGENARDAEEGGEPTTANPSTPAADPKVTVEHVTAAARAVEESTEKPIGPLSRKELIQSFEQFDSPAYGHKNGAVRKFIVYMVDTYAKGNGSPTMFKRLFNAAVKGAEPGTPEPEKETPAPAPKAAATKKADKAAPAKKTDKPAKKSA